jgi:ABC-type glutathione transport system ATPase component
MEDEEERRNVSPTSPPRFKDDVGQPPLATSATSATSDVIRAVPTNTSHGENVISLQEVDPVSVYLDHLNVTVDQSPSPFNKILAQKKVDRKDGAASNVKTILDDVSADMQSGTLTAIIGGSGSGKTSLLNQMSGRMKGNRLSVSGRTLFNGCEDASGIRSAYVIQQDILLPTLTVRETLTYAAQLRLPPSISREEKARLVEEVIMELSLKEAADTRIGNHEHKGCSGGEKRRTSLGVQVRLITVTRYKITDFFVAVVKS